MYEFPVPEDITIDPVEDVAQAIRAAGGKVPDTFTFRRYALECWANDATAIRGSFLKLQRWIGVVDKLAKANPGDRIRLEDQDWLTLKSVIEGGQVYYQPLVAIQLVPFPLAVVNAEKLAA